MRVEGFLRESLRRFPDKIALVAGEVRLTYREFASRVARLAQELRARGVQRGDRVVVFQHNGADAAVAIFGVLEAGAVFSPLHPSTKADKLAYVLNHSGARAIITEPRLAEELRARGVKRGDRVVVFQHNSADAAVAIFAVLEAGAVFSPLHPSTKADKLAYVLNHCGARAIIT